MVVHRPHWPFLLFICLASALGGFLWGFDAIVISGTIGPVKEQFGLSSVLEGLFVSSGLFGAVLGSAAAGWLSDRFGRSRNLILAAALMLASAAGSALAPDMTWLILARWVGGLGVGISAMVCPLYISEVSPAHLRGGLVTVFQLAITLGILVALLSNAALFDAAATLGAGSGGLGERFLAEETWRAMFAVELLPGILFLLMAFALPESPRWLMKTGRDGESLAVLERIFADGAQGEADAIREAIAAEEREGSHLFELLRPEFRRPLFVAVMLAVFAQFSGINVVFYYGPSVLEGAGFGAGEALGGFGVIGIFNMLFTMVAIAFVDRLGRRALMFVGTLGAIGCLIGIGAMIDGDTGLLIPLICGFVAFFAFSLGPVKFIFASEVFPTNVRSHAMSVAILAMWTADTIVGQLFPLMRDGLGTEHWLGRLHPTLSTGLGASGCFYVFAAILVPQLLMVWKLMPETAGKSLEEIEAWYRR